MLSNKEYEKLTEYINFLSDNYGDLLGGKSSKEEKVLASILTMNEELGEFTDEIKRSLGLSLSAKKRSEYQKENLENEAADALISLLLLIKSVGIDNLDEVIHRKIEKNNKRGY